MTTLPELSNGDIHRRLIEWFCEWEEATHEPRRLAERDRDYYDGKQWTDTELRELAKRGQPAIVNNRIAPKINFVLGTESKGRVDPHAYPRTEMHQEDAEVATDALRYIADIVDFNQLRTAVAEDMFIEGYGATIFGVEEIPLGDEPYLGDPESPQRIAARPIEFGEGIDAKDERRVRITEEQVPWDRIWYDPHSRRPNFSDAQYTGVVVWRDFDDAVHDPLFEGNHDHIVTTKGNASTNTSIGLEDTSSDRPRRWYDTRRDRVQILECYWRMRGLDGVMHWWYAVYTEAGFLVEPELVPFRNEDGATWNPMRLTSSFVDRENWRYGIVRAMISPQDEINKRRSKSLHLLSTRQIIYEEGAILEPNEAQTELAKPDGAVKVQSGFLRDGGFQVSPTGDLAAGHVSLLQQAIQDLDRTGPSAALAAIDDKRLSGRAFLARQQAGSLEMEPVFDNLRAWTLDSFKCKWWLIKQYMTEEMWFRVRDDELHDGFRFVALNRKLTKRQRVLELREHSAETAIALKQVLGEGAAEAFRQGVKNVAQQAEKLQQPMEPAKIEEMVLTQILMLPVGGDDFTANDVAKMDIDLVLDTAPDTTIIEHEEFQELITLAGQGVPIPPDVIIEASNLRNKRKLLSLMRKEQSPEAQQMAMQQQQLALQQLQATVAKLQADAQKSAALAKKADQEADAVQFSAQLDQSKAIKTAAEASQIEDESELLAQTPAILS